MACPRVSAFIALSLLWSVTPTSAQTVRGLLVDEHTGQPVALGVVKLISEDHDSLTATLTTEEGYFELTAPGSGSYLLVAEAYGYWASLVGPFEVEDDTDRIVEARVSARPVDVAGLEVEAEALSEPRISHLVANGFYDRLTRGRGEFITPAQIAASDATYFQQLFYESRSVRVIERPAVRISSLRAQNRSAGPSLSGVSNVRVSDRDRNRRARRRALEVLKSRTAMSNANLVGTWGNELGIRSTMGGVCSPWLYVDGIRVFRNPGEAISDVLPMDEVEAVEVYRAPFEGELQFRDISRCECGALVVWTKPYTD